MRNTAPSNNAPADVLVADGDAKSGAALSAFLRERGYRVEWVRDAQSAFNYLDAHAPGGLVTEFRKNHFDGPRLMAVAFERNPEVCVIFIAEARDAAAAAAAMLQGAADFQTRPLHLEKIEAVLRRGSAQQLVVFENMALKQRLDERFGMGRLIGQSRTMAHLYETVRRLARSDAPVLICGEPGSGKSLIAQTLHQAGPRRDEPFVRVDCARFSEPVTRAELFGQAAESRKGQERARPGYFELAARGTLYLEGLAACAQSLHDDILRVIQERCVRRLGDNKRIPVEARLVISAEQRPYAASGGRSRVRLFETLTQTLVEAPALRSRPEDIPLLAADMLAQANETLGRHIEGFSREVLDTFAAHPWPGNLRELENVIGGMVAAAAGPRLEQPDLPAGLRGGDQAAPGEIRLAVGSTMHAIEREAIEATLRHCQGDKAACSAMLGIGLRTLYRKLAEYQA